MSRGSTSDVSFLSGGAIRTPSEYESPSTLACSPRFNSWALAANIWPAHVPSPASKFMFNELCKFKLPKSFLRPLHESALRSEKFFYSKLNAWATSNPTLLVDDDIHRISEHSQILSHAYFSISNSLQKKSKQAAQKRGVDQITELAFDSEDTSIHNVLMEPDLRLRFSSNQSIRVGANAISDTLAVLPFPAGLTDRIFFAMGDMAEPINLETSYGNAFWSKDISGENSLIVFAGEYKRDDGTRNKNQLAMDFGAAQSQRRALGLDPGIIWGATCAKGCFEVFSSEWVNNSISYASHHQWNLLDPVDFMQCYSFLRTLAGTTATLQQQLEGVDATNIAQSVVSSSWRATTPPTTAGLNKRKRSNSSGAHGPFVKGANSEGVDDLEPEESNQWHESMKDWQLESQRLDVQPSKFGLPLKQHLVTMFNRV